MFQKAATVTAISIATKIICGIVVGFGVFGASSSNIHAAPIYDMRDLLGAPHPFLQAPPPAAPQQSPQQSPQQFPEVPVMRPRGTPAERPTSGSGPMMMPRTGTVSGGSSGRDERFIEPTRSSAPSVMAKDPAPRKSKPFISEIRIGALAHDQGPFSSHKEKGYDANLEILFSSPSFFDIIWSPRPHIGATYNAFGNTSQAYVGLSWEWDFWRDFFGGFSLGGAVHNGETTTLALDKKELGCRFLFRESITLGYRLNKTHSIMAHFDHISNAKLCSSNEGLETVGIRYGYRF